MSLFAELKRRNVFRVSIAYVVLAWIVLQVGDTMAPALHLPEWINSALAFFLILGFPLAIFFAWAFEMTPEGLKLEKYVDRDASITPMTGRKLDRTIIAMLVVALGYFIWQSQKAPDEVIETAGGRQSIAVLPFVNMSSDAEQEYFSDGLSEELLNLLAKIPDLHVASRTSAFSFKGKDIQISEIGKELGVAHVLEGSVRKSGAKIRITAQLIQVDNDAHLWSETWDRNLHDIFVIQDEIAKAVVGELKVHLMGEVPQAIEADPEAFSLFLQARHTINQRTYESLLRGEELIARAIELDPDYAPAWILKASIHSQQGDVGARLPKDVLPLAKEALNRAIELDPGNGAAHALAGDIMISFEHNFRDAGREFELALEAAPYDVDVLYQAGVYHAFIGDLEEALRLGLLAHERDPLFIPNLALLSYTYNITGEFDQSEKYARKRIDVSPNSFGSYAYLAHPLILQGRYDEALEVLEKESLDGFRFAGLAIVQYLLGNQAASDEALLGLTSVTDGGWDYQLVEVYSVRGEIDEAFAAMDAAYENRDTGMQLILGDRYLDNLRNDPRYDAMVEKMGLRAAAD